MGLSLSLMLISRGDGSDCRLEAKSRTMLTFCSYVKPPRSKPGQCLIWGEEQLCISCPVGSNRRIRLQWHQELSEDPSIFTRKFT